MKNYILLFGLAVCAWFSLNSAEQQHADEGAIPSAIETLCTYIPDRLIQLTNRPERDVVAEEAYRLELLQKLQNVHTSLNEELNAVNAELDQVIIDNEIVVPAAIIARLRRYAKNNALLVLEHKAKSCLDMLEGVAPVGIEAMTLDPNFYDEKVKYLINWVIQTYAHLSIGMPAESLNELPAIFYYTEIQD